MQALLAGPPLPQPGGNPQEAPPPLPPGPPPPLYDQQTPSGYQAAAAAYQPAAPTHEQPPLPGGVPFYGLDDQQAAYDQQAAPQQQQQRKKKQKRGRRGGGGGGGLGPQRTALKQQGRQPPTQLGFFSQVPSLHDLRQENFRRTQAHYGPPGGRAQQQKQHGPGRPGGHRRSRGGKAAKAAKAGKFPALTPRPVPLTPAAGNPLDTPANAGAAAASAPHGGDADQLEAEGLAPGLDWYGTNENSAALFLAGQAAATTSDSGPEDWDDMEGGSEGEGHSGGGGSGGGGGPDADAGSGGWDERALPRGVKARLVEQEAYIAELEDQNLRLREQLELLQQEVEELRGGRAPADSEEGYAEHSEGSLPADHSVMNPHH